MVNLLKQFLTQLKKENTKRLNFRRTRKDLWSRPRCQKQTKKSNKRIRGSNVIEILRNIQPFYARNHQNAETNAAISYL